MQALSQRFSVGRVTAVPGRDGFSLTFLIAPLSCRNKDFRTRSFPAGVAACRSNHLVLLPYLRMVLITYSKRFVF